MNYKGGMIMMMVLLVLELMICLIFPVDQAQRFVSRLSTRYVRV